MKRFKTGQEYFYPDIEAMANGADYEIVEHGPEVLGENFLCLKPNDPNVNVPFLVSFIMTSYRQGAYYTCVYSDFENHPT